MTFICLICKEVITSKSDYDLSNDNSNSSDNKIITTICGHIYHKACLNQSFVIQRKNEKENGLRTSDTLCPKCQRVVYFENTIQIYPEQSKWDENAYFKLLQEKSALFQENIRLKKLLHNQSNEVNQRIAGIVSKDENAALSVPTKSELITYTSDKFQNADSERNHIIIMPENGTSDLAAIQESSISSSHSDVYGHQDCSDENDRNDNPTISHFEKNLQLCSTKFIQARDKLKGVTEEIEILSSEDIDGVAFNIANQITKAESLKRQLLRIKSVTKKLKPLENEMRNAFETEMSEGNLIGSVADLESNQILALESLNRTSQLLKKSLNEVQQIKTFLKSGFEWLGILEDKMREYFENESSKDVECLEKTYNLLYSELKFRRVTIANVKKAMTKFLNIPNSKLACTEQKMLNSVFARYETLERDIEARLLYIRTNGLPDKEYLASA